MSQLPESTRARWPKPKIVAATGSLFGDMGKKVKRKRGPAVDMERHRLALAFLRRLRSGERIERIVGDHTPEYARHLLDLGITVQVRKDDQGLAWSIQYDNPEVEC